MRPVSVSYTHLDVYKRQHSERKNGNTWESVCCIRKNSGNWQITTIIPTKHGFRASIWRNLRNSLHKGKKEFLFHMNYYIIIPENTKNQGGSCAKWTIKQSMRNGFPIRILTKPQKLNCVRSQMIDVYKRQI